MRLIDADKLIEFIDAGHLRHPGEICFSELDVVNMLNHAPTAYKLDMVLEQLEEFRDEMDQFGCGGILTDIIEIVKGGELNG